MRARRYIAAGCIYAWLQIVAAAFGGLTVLVCAVTIMLVCVAIWFATPTTPSAFNEGAEG